MKRLLRIFDLLKNEQRVVLIVILALIAGALVRYERRIHLRAAEAAAAAKSKPSPSPPETEDKE
jgi:phage baseplate assembly protein W